MEFHETGINTSVHFPVTLNANRHIVLCCVVLCCVVLCCVVLCCVVLCCVVLCCVLYFYTFKNWSNIAQGFCCYMWRILESLPKYLISPNLLIWIPYVSNQLRIDVTWSDRSDVSCCSCNLWLGSRAISVDRLCRYSFRRRIILCTFECTYVLCAT